LLNKNTPIHIIKKLSKDRSQRFYLNGIPLPTLSHANDNDINNPDPSDSIPESEIASDAQSNHSHVQKPKKKSMKQSEAERVLRLQLSCETPFLTREEILSMAGISSGSKTLNIQKHLAGEGLILLHRLPVGKTIRLIWEPTSKAYNLYNIDHPDFESKGGYLHQFICHRIKKNLESKGYDVQVEYFLSNGKAVDLIFRKSDKIGFIEIATSQPINKEISNFIKDLETDLKPDWLISAVKDGDMKRSLEKLISKYSDLTGLQNNINFVLAGNLIFSDILEAI